MKINERMVAAVVDAHEFEPACEARRNDGTVTCPRPACWVGVPTRPGCHCGALFRTAFCCEPCRAAWCASPVVACGACGCLAANDTLRFEPIGCP